MSGKGYRCDDEGYGYDGGRTLHALSDTYALVDGHVTLITTGKYRRDGQRNAPMQRALAGKDQIRVVIVPRGGTPPPPGMFNPELDPNQIRGGLKNKHIWVGQVTEGRWRGAGYQLDITDERKQQLKTVAEAAASRLQTPTDGGARALGELVDIAQTCGVDRVALMLDSVSASTWQADTLNAAVLRCRFDLPSMHDEAEHTRPTIDKLGKDAAAWGLRHGTRLARKLPIERDDITVHALARWIQRVDTTLDDTGIADLIDMPDTDPDGTWSDLISDAVSDAADKVTRTRQQIDRIIDHIVACLSDPDGHRGWLPADTQPKAGSLYVQIPAGDGKVANLVLERDRRDRTRFKIVTCYIPSKSLNGRHVNPGDYSSWHDAWKRRQQRPGRRPGDKQLLDGLDNLVVTAVEKAVNANRS